MVDAWQHLIASQQAENIIPVASYDRKRRDAQREALDLERELSLRERERAKKERTRTAKDRSPHHLRLQVGMQRESGRKIAGEGNDCF